MQQGHIIAAGHVGGIYFCSGLDNACDRLLTAVAQDLMNAWPHERVMLCTLYATIHRLHDQLHSGRQ